MTNFLKSAYELASLGYAVFQCAPQLKSPFYLTAPRGCNSATTDLIIVTKNWTQHPNCNVGIKCENLLVLDIDCKENIDGVNDLRNVISSLGKLPDCPLVRTGSGGWHLFFARPEVDVIGTKHVVWQGKKTGIDIQVGNQYVVAPPSIHPNGQIYSWQGLLCKVADLPKLSQRWIDDFLSLRKNNQNTITNLIVPTSSVPVPSTISTLQANHRTIERCRAYISEVEPCISGQGGDKQLFKVASIIFWDFGLSESEGMPILEEYNQRCMPTWNQSRLKYKMQSALNYQHEKPRGYLIEQSRCPTQNNATDISELLTNLSPTPIVQAAETSVCLPERLTFIPGFVDELVRFCLDAAPHPNRVLAFCGAVALMSFLITRKVQTQTGIRPNLYIIALAGSGTGKDYIRKVNHFILESIGQSQSIGETIASGEGLEEAVIANKKMLYQTDEIQTLFAEIASGKESRYNNIVAFLLKVYTSADSVIVKRTKVDAKRYVGNISCNQPGLILFGTTIPEIFFNALTPTLMLTGLGSRCLFIEGEPRQPYNQNAADHKNVPKELIETAQWWCDFIPTTNGNNKHGDLLYENPTPIIVPMSDDALKIMNSLGAYADCEYAKTHDAIEQVLWTRVHEIACKLALIYACSTDYKSPIINQDAACWASEFTTWVIRQMMQMVRHNVAESAFAKLALRAESLIRKRGGIITRNDLSRALHTRPRELDEIIQKLTCEEIIETSLESGTGGRHKICYRLLKSNS
ncbi:MAG: bifunctional DNA primase/polymerase [Planctomycetaceae bacterium]|nr:bifunctional DNA primase/polymerase [Planctomycetaceae bacterium]